jgi:hypothetical protein
MSNGRSSKLWIVNVISFILFIVLFSTGLLNWLVLPRGYEARGSFSVSLRHFFIALHEWAALIFIVVMGCIDIHSCDRSTYCLALALYKIQFEEIWYPEIKLDPKYFLYKIY